MRPGVSSGREKLELLHKPTPTYPHRTLNLAELHGSCPWRGLVGSRHAEHCWRAISEHCDEEIVADLDVGVFVSLS